MVFFMKFICFCQVTLFFMSRNLQDYCIFSDLGANVKIMHVELIPVYCIVHFSGLASRIKKIPPKENKLLKAEILGLTRDKE